VKFDLSVSPSLSSSALQGMPGSESSWSTSFLMGASLSIISTLGNSQALISPVLIGDGLILLRAMQMRLSSALEFRCNNFHLIRSMDDWENYRAKRSCRDILGNTSTENGPAR
jgi:hypothetical protein